MKHTLVILRHGKAESFGIVSEDFARTLVPDGVKEAKYTGNALKKAGVDPQWLYSSAAPRALFTLRFVALELGKDPESVIGDKTLYAADRHTLLATVRSFPEDSETAILCGHNPEISDLIPLLAESGGGLPFLNTADAVILDFPEGVSWDELGGNGTIRQIISQPRRRIS